MDFLKTIDTQTWIIILVGLVFMWFVFKVIRKLVMAIGSLAFTLFWIVRIFQMLQ